MAEGIASYHFDAADDCYISYANADHTWLLDDGRPPPAKKLFVNPAFDAETRTFRGEILWDVPFNGCSRCVYKMVFAKDLSRIIDGQVQEYDAGGFQRDTVFRLSIPFVFDECGMHYVQKPLVLSAGARAVAAAEASVASS